MPEVISYGEDPLTYWALTQRLDEVLSKLGDSSPRDEALVIYRPSFGRGGSAKASRSRDNARSEFGEFDAIVAGQAIYLIEAKWSRSSEHVGERVQLRPQQVLRHDIFRWHLDQWRSDRPATWESFYRARAGEYRGTFPGFALAPPGSLLALNLSFLLARLANGPRQVRDVLLHLGFPGMPVPKSVAPPRFHLVHLEATTLNDGGYFRLQ